MIRFVSLVLIGLTLLGPALSPALALTQSQIQGQAQGNSRESSRGFKSNTYQQQYPVEALAGVMGELHYLSFTCDGRSAQDWREAMAEMLEFEAPTRGNYRQRLVEAFNEGFYTQSRLRPRCGSEAEFQQRQLAQRGQSLSEQIRRTYID